VAAQAVAVSVLLELLVDQVVVAVGQVPLEEQAVPEFLEKAMTVALGMDLAVPQTAVVVAEAKTLSDKMPHQTMAATEAQA
jgi:hypothetical protein